MSADTLTVIIFAVLVVATIGISVWASRKNTDASQQWVAGKNIKGWQNGLAITSDYLSASAFLGIVGAIALGSFSAFYLSTAAMLGYIFMLLILAEPLRNLGRYTMADVFSTRFSNKGVRAVAAVSTVIVSIMYMIGQLVGSGLILNLLVGIDYTIAVVIIGILMAIYVSVGGMRGTTWIQILQAVVLVAAILILAILVLARFSFSPLAIFNEVANEAGASVLRPSHGVEGLNWISTNVAIAVSVLGLPHILMRFFTVPDTRAARSSVSVAMWIIGASLLVLPLVAYGAVLLVGQGAIENASGGGNLTAPQLAEALGGPVLLAFISAAAFAAILSTVAGLAIAASSAFAHDFYTEIIRNGEASERERVRVARISGIGIAIISIILALGVQGFNISILVTLAQAVAASANVPVILLTLFWRRFNTTGAIGGMLVGLVASLGLLMISPSVMGENALFPLGNPALVSVPIGFLGCYLATVLSSSRAREEREQGMQVPYEDIYVRSNLGGP